MLMNKSLLFYILSMVGRQQARNGRKANLFIPQITIHTSRRTNHSWHCRGPGESRDSPSPSIRKILSQPKFPFKNVFSPCPLSPTISTRHATSIREWTTSPFGEDTAPSPDTLDSTADSKARLSEKSGYYLPDILLEKRPGVMRDDSRAANRSTMTANDTASERVGQDPWGWRGWHFGGPSRASWCRSARSWEDWEPQGRRVGSHWDILIGLALDLPLLAGGFAVETPILLFGDSHTSSYLSNKKGPCALSLPCGSQEGRPGISGCSGLPVLGRQSWSRDRGARRQRQSWAGTRAFPQPSQALGASAKAAHT